MPQLTTTSTISKSSQKQRSPQILGLLCSIFIFSSACGISYTTFEPTATAEVTAVTSPTVTSVPPPSPTHLPTQASKTVILDFVAQLCSADWMNGAKHLAPCPQNGGDLSEGHAIRYPGTLKGFPADAPILLMATNAGGLFLRYPAIPVNAEDHFRTTLLCTTSGPCDVQFAFDYFDADNKFHEFMNWNYKTGDAPIEVDVPLSSFAGQQVSFMLTLRLFHQVENPQNDNGLWVAPRIERSAP